MILFGVRLVVTGYAAMGLNQRFLGQNLSTFLVCVWSRYCGWLEVNVFKLFNTQVELLL